MHYIDLSIISTYLIVLLGVGYYFFNKNDDLEAYYLGGRTIGPWHIGLSVVATDVGGGFSIGLGGLGFIMGLSGSWMLFTGFLGAWLSAVFLIPKIRRLPAYNSLSTFPQVFERFYGGRVALVAGIISAIGYFGFASSQLLAGAKLASASFVDLELNHALWVMGFVAVVYTFMGGIKAVIYTDTVQWIILMVGLIMIAIPMAFYAVGGWAALRMHLPKEFFRLDNVGLVQIINWTVTIIPIWFVGMTLYQRIFASRSEKDAKKAWFIAGFFEWPLMAFMGVILGVLGKVAYQQGMFADLGFPVGTDIDAEMGLPLLLREVLPVGLLGIVFAAYFSAILSTADSCLMASSGNIITDILKKFFNITIRKELKLSQLITLLTGLGAVLVAGFMTNVLELMLMSYAFLVSGLFIPLVGALYWRKASATGAMAAMITGGVVTSILMTFGSTLPFDLDANIFGLTSAFFVFIIMSYVFPKQ